MCGGLGAVFGLVGVLERLEGRQRGRLKGRGWLRGGKARGWRPGLLVSSCTIFAYTDLGLQ